ncbi:MAG TPA: phosphatidate cytidylyltransferase [Thermoanaerobaculia bacterium]|nr:phosphatidate cytidylyltransferase [Thermoanaerobaculia bacterium]HQR67444.1 phosphatidate cytidylyltransferase [Thermoanaerobaculia bacterium]
MRFQRELTAAVLIPAVLAILVVAPLWAWALLVALAAGLALAEFFRLLKSAGWAVPQVAGFAVFLAIVAAAHFRFLPGIVVATAAALLLLPTLVMFSAPPVGVLLASSASSVFATLYVALGAAAMIALRALGWRPVIFVLAVVWASDSAAYYVGRRFGRRKLAPVVSPKKTWEGLWGQLGAGLLVGLLARVLLFPAGSVPGLALLGLGAAGLAVVGDLLESTFKRSCDVKDSGGLLPGHGGFLDRLDSLLYVSPPVLGVALFLPEVLS